MNEVELMSLLLQAARQLSQAARDLESVGLLESSFDCQALSEQCLVASEPIWLPDAQPMPPTAKGTE